MTIGTRSTAYHLAVLIDQGEDLTLLPFGRSWHPRGYLRGILKLYHIFIMYILTLFLMSFLRCLRLQRYTLFGNFPKKAPK